ncbi:hypothetical protein KUV44_01845 [Marinobacter daepoensis]|uniref:Uncharacterized protein n=1 Tax=Marinobacter daepoensis TaxID=262077 RepID=A0ABS3BBF4_9GAMM|nr:hypothetical protein [Marinobacter daepoensis]MBN7769188.1 hypothetical protein [Marinobacter daepoensis]MBY6077878.1 hypothetical protein [Marinobacter daepoensis]
MVEFISAAVLSGVIYDICKTQARVTGSAIKKRLKAWIVDDVTAEKIADEVNRLGVNQDQSEAAIERQISHSEKLTQLLKEVKPSNSTTINQYHSGSGDNVGRDKVGKDV